MSQHMTLPQHVTMFDFTSVSCSMWMGLIQVVDCCLQAGKPCAGRCQTGCVERGHPALQLDAKIRSGRHIKCCHECPCYRASSQVHGKVQDILGLTVTASKASVPVLPMFLGGMGKKPPTLFLRG